MVNYEVSSVPSTDSDSLSSSSTETDAEEEDDDRPHSHQPEDCFSGSYLWKSISSWSSSESLSSSEDGGTSEYGRFVLDGEPSANHNELNVQHTTVTDSSNEEERDLERQFNGLGLNEFNDDDYSDISTSEEEFSSFSDNSESGSLMSQSPRSANTSSINSFDSNGSKLWGFPSVDLFEDESSTLFLSESEDGFVEITIAEEEDEELCQQDGIDNKNKQVKTLKRTFSDSIKFNDATDYEAHDRPVFDAEKMFESATKDVAFVEDFDGQNDVDLFEEYEKLAQGEMREQDPNLYDHLEAGEGVPPDVRPLTPGNRSPMLPHPPVNFFPTGTFLFPITTARNSNGAIINNLNGPFCNPLSGNKPWLGPRVPMLLSSTRPNMEYRFRHPPPSLYTPGTYRPTHWPSNLAQSIAPIRSYGTAQYQLRPISNYDAPRYPMNYNLGQPAFIRGPNEFQPNSIRLNYNNSSQGQPHETKDNFEPEGHLNDAKLQSNLPYDSRTNSRPSWIPKEPQLQSTPPSIKTNHYSSSSLLEQPQYSVSKLVPRQASSNGGESVQDLDWYDFEDDLGTVPSTSGGGSFHGNRNNKRGGANRGRNNYRNARNEAGNGGGRDYENRKHQQYRPNSQQPRGPKPSYLQVASGKINSWQ